MTHAALKTIAAFLNTEGGDLLIGVADDGAIVGIERDQLENDDKFMLHLAQVVRNGLGDRAGICIDPKTQVLQGKSVCVVTLSAQSRSRSFLKWKGIEAAQEGDFFVRRGPGTINPRPAAPRSTSAPDSGPGNRSENHPHTGTPERLRPRLEPQICSGGRDGHGDGGKVVSVR